MTHLIDADKLVEALENMTYPTSLVRVKALIKEMQEKSPEQIYDDLCKEPISITRYPMKDVVTDQPVEYRAAFEKWFGGNPPLENKWSGDAATGFEAGWEAARVPIPGMALMKLADIDTLIDEARKLPKRESSERLDVCATCEKCERQLQDVLAKLSESSAECIKLRVRLHKPAGVELADKLFGVIAREHNYAVARLGYDNFRGYIREAVAEIEQERRGSDA